MKKLKVDLAFRRLELKKFKIIGLSPARVSEIKGGDGTNTVIIQPKPTVPPPQPPIPPEPRPETRDSRVAGCTIAGN